MEWIGRKFKGSDARGTGEAASLLSRSAQMFRPVGEGRRGSLRGRQHVRVIKVMKWTGGTKRGYYGGSTQAACETIRQSSLRHGNVQFERTMKLDHSTRKLATHAGKR